jgi:uncharacterized protein (DUF885 family)
MIRAYWLGFQILAALLVAQAWCGAQTAFEQACHSLAARSGDDAARLHELFKLDWEHTMQEQPEFATSVGYPGQNDRWTDLSLSAIERRKHEASAPLKVIESINRARLNDADQLNYDLFKYNAQQAIEEAKFPGEYLAITQLDGVQQDIARVLAIAPRATVKHYDDILARLKAAPRLIAQTAELLKQGLERKITPPRITLRDVGQQIKEQMDSDPEQSALLKPFAEFPPQMPEKDRARLKQAAVEIVKSQVVPAYSQLYDFFTQNYLPNTRESIALSDLPDGKDWYAFAVRASTTTRMTPEEIHKLGLAEVARIRKEMDAVIARTGFKGSFADFSKFLRSDPKFFYTDAESLVRAYRDIAKRADPELAHLFGKLPRLPYGVKPVPAYAEKSQTTAYYEDGSVAAGRPGWFFANTYALNTRPKWEMVPLTLHEAVPGHHLQISLAEEMEQAPEFRKFGGYTAFVEGWGLYAESLGEEMGFYKEPYEKYGQLTYEMWRAVRLVLDTGIHSMGWSRQQAIDYFVANSSKTEHDITVEVDRYIVMPGQALAYKIGELKFKELRAYAAQKLGSQFNIRRFHDEVLDSGALPMDVLDQRVRLWVERESPGR